MPIFYVHAIGAGDIKLIIIISCYVGFKTTISISIVSFFFGGILSIIHLFRKKIFLRQMKAVSNYLIQIIYCKKVVPYTERAEENANVIHFSFPILLSVLMNIGGVLYSEIICSF